MDFEEYEVMEVELPNEAKEAVRLSHEAAAYAQDGQFDEAVNSAERIEHTKFRLWYAYRNEALINVAAKCAEAGLTDRALEIAEKIAADYRPGALYWIALAYARFGQRDTAFQIARSIGNARVREDVLSKLESGNEK